MVEKKKDKDVQVVIRMESQLHQGLKKEAGSQGRPLANYIRLLLETHPARAKTKK